MGAWAQLPSRWILNPKQEGGKPGLALVDWSSHRDTAWAAMRIAMGLAIRLNESHKDQPLYADAQRAIEVRCSYDELQVMGGVARQTVGRAISLLEDRGALKIRLVGRSNWYELTSLKESGGWCQLPQEHLRHAGAKLGKLNGLLKNRQGLNALKLYLLLLALRNWRQGTTAIGYTKIEERAGIRRQDIPNAIAALVTSELVKPLPELIDSRHNEDKSRRYQIVGLPIAHRMVADVSGNEAEIAKALVSGTAYEPHLG